MKLRTEFPAASERQQRFLRHALRLQRAEPHAADALLGGTDSDSLCQRLPGIHAEKAEVDAGQHDLAEALRGKRFCLRSKALGRHGAAAPARIGNDAVGAELVAAVLDFQKCACALGIGAGERGECFARLIRRDLCLRDRGAGAVRGDKLQQGIPVFRAGDKIRIGEVILRERLRPAARQHDQCIRMLAAEAAQKLLCFADALCGDSTAVDEQKIGRTAVFCKGMPLCAEHLG